MMFLPLVFGNRCVLKLHKMTRQALPLVFRFGYRMIYGLRAFNRLFRVESDSERPSGIYRQSGLRTDRAEAKSDGVHRCIDP